MAYSVTGIRATPDVGFATGHRRTAEGARDLATAFVGDGLREVEVRDGHGNLLSLAELDRARDDTWDFGIASQPTGL